MGGGDADGGHGEPPSEPAAGPHLSGQLILARLEYLQRERGAPSVQEVLQALLDDDRRLLRGVDRRKWYPFGLLARLDRAIARHVGAADETFFERLGEASARHRTEWLGEDARLYSVHGFLSRVADEHRRFHTFGRAVYRRTGFEEGELAYSEYPEVDRVYCQSAVGFFRASVGFLTGRPATVVERTCQCNGDAACVFVVRWRSEKGGLVARIGGGGASMLEEGTPAPDFEVKDHTGRTVRLSDLRGKNVLLWFYPAADTPG